MLRIFRIALKEVVSNICIKNCAPYIRMSSEAVSEVPTKRKSEESLDEVDSSSKKVKMSDENIVDAAVETILKNSNRIRKPKKAVLLMSYLGKEFFGMQRNSNVSTVEECLLKALLDAGIILEDEFNFPKTMKFQRAARTDKGVSAVRQIVSLKIPLQEINNEFPEKVNKYLPPEIRIIAIKRVTQSFDAKIACDARTYSYMLPTFAFSPDTRNDEEYRIPVERIEEVNKFLQNYLGTHNFYNFTSGRLAGDPSCKRYIIACECGPPFMSRELEFSVIKVKGQSFMLHQIRKMVGLAIAYMKNLADESVLKKAWLNERIDIPKAPGLGLMLEELHYDWYNKKYGSDGMHDALVWDEYNEVTEKFKRDKICSNIALTEREEKSMIQWLETLPYHSYDVRDAGPPTKLSPKASEKSNEIDSSTEKSSENVEINNSLEKSSKDSENETEIHVNPTVNSLPCVNNQPMSTNEKGIKCES